MSFINKNIQEVFTFKDVDFSTFYGKSVLLETNNKFYIGVLNPNKTGLSITNKKGMQSAIQLFDVKSILCENIKIVIKENIQPVDVEHWNNCISEAKKSTVKGVTHKACKCYENVSGKWESKIKKQIIEELPLNEDLMLRDRLKSVFFENRIILNEKDIVNHEHENSMTPEEIAKRDELAAALKAKGKCKVTKGKDKTVDNACHRMATYLTIGRGSGHSTEKSAGTSWVHHHGEFTGKDRTSRRNAAAPGLKSKMAASFIPGTFSRKNKSTFFSIHKGPGEKSRKRGALATAAANKAHRESMTAYRTAMANMVKDPTKRAELLKNIRTEYRSKTAVSRRAPRKSRAKKKP